MSRVCDLSKDFDSVNHEMLMEKLTKVKIDPFWFGHYEYLLDRSQVVRINNTVSTKDPHTVRGPPRIDTGSNSLYYIY